MIQHTIDKYPEVAEATTESAMTRRWRKGKGKVKGKRSRSEKIKKSRASVRRISSFLYVSHCTLETMKLGSACNSQKRGKIFVRNDIKGETLQGKEGELTRVFLGFFFPFVSSSSDMTVRVCFTGYAAVNGPPSGHPGDFEGTSCKCFVRSAVHAQHCKACSCTHPAA